MPIEEITNQQQDARDLITKQNAERDAQMQRLIEARERGREAHQKEMEQKVRPHVVVATTISSS